MTDLSKSHHDVLNKILESLGMRTHDIEQCAETDGYRIDFEQNFTVELQQIPESGCRVSARIFSLGKSLQVQDDQLRKAMSIFSEVSSDLPEGVSLAVSDHDNCLRICIEITTNNANLIVSQFNSFVQIAFAYKQTYFKHKNDRS